MSRHQLAVVVAAMLSCAAICVGQDSISKVQPIAPLDVELQSSSYTVTQERQESLEDLPQAVYTSTIPVRMPPLSWFESNMVKAQKILNEYRPGNGYWAYQDAYVAAFRFEGLCKWAKQAHPMKRVRMCEAKREIASQRIKLAQEHPDLLKKAPWEWLFSAEERKAVREDNR